MRPRKADRQLKETNQAEESMPTFVLTSRPRTTVSINDGSLQVDGIELSKYIKNGSIIVRPGDESQPSEVTVTFLADRLHVDRSADQEQERMQLG